jgi:hypothetical protein
MAYCSRRSRDFKQSQLEDILSSSRTHNESDGITGVLISAGDRFLQVLEGEKHVLQPCFERVLADKRHADAITLIDAPAERRWFENWSMGLVRHSSQHWIATSIRQIETMHKTTDADFTNSLISVGLINGILKAALEIDAGVFPYPDDAITTPRNATL